MVINDENALKDCKLILGALILKHNVKKHARSGLPIVIVEGSIDSKFYNLHGQNNVLFLTISELSKNVHLSESDKLVNNNILITEILYTIQDENFRMGECKGDIYGIIDKDFEEKDSIVFTIPQLFVTDTHDLETSLLYSDNGLLQRMGIYLSEDSYETTILLSYEFALIRKYLYGSEAFKVRNLLDDDSAIDFHLFTTNNELDVRKVFSYLNSLKAYPFKEQIIQNYIRDFASLHSNLISDSGVFNIKNSNYKKLVLCTVWDYINGHDFCSALRFVSAEAAQNYPAASGDNKRYMETVMVEKYEFSNFKKLDLGKKMRDAALLKG